MLIQNINRVVAWVLLSAIVVLTVVPPGLRPSTFVPHKIEHAAIFLMAGTSLGMAYLGRERLLSVGAIVFARHSNLRSWMFGDDMRVSAIFIVNATAAVVGVFVSGILLRTWFAFL